MPEILRSLPLADEILESHRHRAHGDDAGFDAYKAHVYRVVNFARALTPDGPDRDDKLAIAAAFLLEGPVRDLLEHVRHRLRKLPS